MTAVVRRCEVCDCPISRFAKRCKSHPSKRRYGDQPSFSIIDAIQRGVFANPPDCRPKSEQTEEDRKLWGNMIPMIRAERPDPWKEGKFTTERDGIKRRGRKKGAE